MKQNLNRTSKHLVHVTVGKENYEVKVVMGKYDFHCLETDNIFDHSNGGNGGGDDDDDDDGDDNRTWLPWKNVIAIDWR